MIGIRMTVEVDGVQEDREFTMRLPTHIFNQPREMLDEAVYWLNQELGTDLEITFSKTPDAEVVKPKRIKARRKVTHDEFNRRIGQLGYKG